MITIVTPWYGANTAGGAETQARSLAHALQAIGVAVRVWSSTARDSFHPDENACYPAGSGTEEGIPIWRFVPTPANERGIPHFFSRHPHLLPTLDGVAAHELQLLGTLLSSDELYEAIIAEAPQSRFIFMPYPFPTTFWGALLAPERSFLLPCLHNEPYAYYATYRSLFRQVRGILCNSEPEARLAQRLYALPAERVHVPGEGINLQPRGDAAAFWRRFGFPDMAAQRPSLLLYVGRRDASKNIALLLAYTREYWARRGLSLHLLLAGNISLAVPPALDARREPDLLIYDMGYIEEQEKHDAYAAADLFVLPSLYESFSIVLMEAWLQGTPALVHAACDVTTHHCQQSGGGLAFDDFGSFAAALDMLLPQPALRQMLGARGRDYVLQTCDWAGVARRTAAAVLEGG